MKELNDLIDRAEREGKWLFCHYQSLWFSPSELRQHNAVGRFRWGVVNWTLRDPSELLDSTKAKLKHAQEELENVTRRIQEASATAQGVQ